MRIGAGGQFDQLCHKKFRESLPPNFYEVLASRFCHARQLQPPIRPSR